MDVANNPHIQLNPGQFTGHDPTTTSPAWLQIDRVGETVNGWTRVEVGWWHPPDQPAAELARDVWVLAALIPQEWLEQARSAAEPR
jgi:hypothetical protein